MNRFVELFESAYFPYLQQEERVTLPPVVHEHKTGYVWPSKLFLCPLQAALEQEKAEPTYPAASKGPMTYHRMNSGTRAAEPIQEAFLWKYPGYVEIELPREMKGQCPVLEPNAVYLPDTEKLFWKMRGRIDLFWNRVDIDTECHIAEIKNSKGLWFHQVMQVIAYDLLFREYDPQLHIITVNKDEINLWDIDRHGAGYLVRNTANYGFDSYGQEKTEYPDELWDIAQNITDVLNRENLEQEISRHWEYVQGKRDDPMPDFLNHSQGWLCAKKKTYPKDEKPGKFVPRCEWFCHGPVEDNEFTKDNGKYVWLTEVF